MPLSPLAGAATLTVKVSEFNAFIAALNSELDILRERMATYESQFGGRLTILEGRPEVPDLSAQLTALVARVDGLEVQPPPAIPPDLTTRVEALEALVQRVPAENPMPLLGLSEALPRPTNLLADEVALVYDKATIYYGDVEMHALRIAENKWRLLAQLNFVVVSPVLWTYDEIVEGTPEEVYEHATRRLMELAELKPQHDRVHERVREMSEGRQ